MYASLQSCLSSLSVRPLPSRAEGRRRSLALPSRRTAARRRRALKMTPTQSGDRGAFHIVSTHSNPLHTGQLASIFVDGEHLIRMIRISFVVSYSNRASCHICDSVTNPIYLFICFDLIRLKAGSGSMECNYLYTCHFFYVAIACFENVNN